MRKILYEFKLRKDRYQNYDYNFFWKVLVVAHDIQEARKYLLEKMNVEDTNQSLDDFDVRTYNHINQIRRGIFGWDYQEG
jgi:hypothetical protein